MTPEIKCNGITVTVEEVAVSEIPKPSVLRVSKWQPLLNDIALRLEKTAGTVALRYDFPAGNAATYAAIAIRKHWKTDRRGSLLVSVRSFNGSSAVFVRHGERKIVTKVR